LPNYKIPLFLLASRRFRLLWLLGASAGLIGCASIGPPLPPSLELPRPPTDLRAVRKADKVTLTWTIPTQTMQRQGVRHLGRTDICRVIVHSAGEHSRANQTSGNQSDKITTPCDHPGKEYGTIVGTAPPPANPPTGDKKAAQKKQTAIFVDAIPKSIEEADPYGSALFSVEVLNPEDRDAGPSNSASVSLVPTLAPFGSFGAQVAALGVMISWDCPEHSGALPGVNYLFRIYRRADGGTDAKITDVDADRCAGKIAGGNRSNAQQENQTEAVNSYLDQTIVWETTYFYRGTVVSVVPFAGKPVEVEGDDTPEVKVLTHDIFPPAVPTGLQAVFSGPGQQPFIDLIWAPVTDADLAGYNVYRREEGSAEVRINSELVKTPAYRDTQVVSGKTYFYSVSALDERGNESARSAETSETMP
jgi:hypothetical protein